MPRGHHEMTLSEFLELVENVEEPKEGYPWDTDDETVIDELESFIRVLECQQGLADTTVATKRSRFATYAQLYDELLDQANLVDRVVDDSERTAEIHCVLAAFDNLDADLGTDASKHAIGAMSTSSTAISSVGQLPRSIQPRESARSTTRFARREMPSRPRARTSSGCTELPRS